ncbi:hypothetical protein J2752_000959 [Halarchaeum rubridurum]|uniref:Uncharacterized protein n=1 Tax=Halarchaeum rubridurum TaxID=489911 RepID=A0A830FP97_9EURY|nr:hypothetical protein [Halarchaeum rubridurum]MBP1954078.1 hypothetical protein [Halarchaeum rubridurum]GGM57133.1 hypothetical protein GCM10009017_04170 [Halarchaeum rubridurum]
MAKYEPIITWVFEQQAEEYGTDEEIPFHRDHIEQAMEALDIHVGNVPDIPYAYRSRRPLPDQIAQYGYTAVVIDDKREGEDPTYLFTKTEQLIPVPEVVDETHRTSIDALPDPVHEYIGKDEQGVLTQVRYAGLLDDFTGLDTYHLQSHLRMRVRGREAELDDLYVGVDPDGDHVALAIEAKGDGETLNRNQLIRNTRGIEDEPRYPDSVRTLAVKLDEEGYFYLFEFEVFRDGDEDRVETDRVWKYEFESE